MTETEIWETLTEIFREIFEDDEIVIGPETDADQIDNWDSLTHVQLIVAVEDSFGVHFNTGEVAGLANVGEMVALVRRRIT